MLLVLGPAISRRFALITLCVFVAGCAASGAVRRAHQAEQRQDYDLAVVEYTKAIRLHPDDVSGIARMANISVIFDPAFRDAPVSVDLRNATLEDALNTVAAATRTFFRVTAPRTVVIIPDTPAKRREYEEQVVRTFYLSNADLKETMDLLRMVLDARRISPTTATNALTIKDTPERIAAAARVLSAADKARPEGIIDVELLEVNRTRLLDYGPQVAPPGPAGING